LNMSTSAASRLLSGLERTTGLKLFSRDGHALRPTAEGTQYFNECHRVLVAVDELPRAANRLASGAQSRLTVGSGPRLANSLMIPAIGRFAKKNSGAEIDFKVFQPHEFPRMTDRMDIAVGAMLPQSITSVEASPLFEMPTVAVMRNDHPLARRSTVRVADLAAHKLIATPTGPMREELEHMFHAEGAKFHPQYTATSFEHACSLGLEGIVCKRIDVPYRAGGSKHWLKLKNRAHPAIMRVKRCSSWNGNAHVEPTFGASATDGCESQP